MKVFNLKCEHGHPFEGWFKSHLAFEDQRSRGLLTCPFCDSRNVEKTLSAPRLNLSGAQAEVASGVAQAPESTAEFAAPVSAAIDPKSSPTLAQALKVVRQLLERSEDVGDRFAQEARSMHRQESPLRPIHGSTSLETARELADEGLPIVPIPFAGLLKNSLH
ncbi:MAG: DUF1178 family protein [Betaproteobacteria bacterium]|jgi:hypothetical protein|nr:DUF1178 family protein [Betaproteobacteria bacterium]